MLKFCVICGKKFETQTAAKTCRSECKKALSLYTSSTKRKRKDNKVLIPKKVIEIHNNTFVSRDETLCWSCQNATGGCSWSKKLKPVRGWTAERIFLKYNENGKAKYDKSYKVVSCPKFKADVLRGKNK